MPTTRTPRGNLNIRDRRTRATKSRRRYTKPRKSNQKTTNNQPPASDHHLAAKTHFTNQIHRDFGENIGSVDWRFITAVIRLVNHQSLSFLIGSKAYPIRHQPACLRNKQDDASFITIVKP